MTQHHQTTRGTIAALLATALFVLGGLMTLTAATASADPNTETVLPADGVLSLTRDGDVWTITTSSPAWEVKVISSPQQIVCGTNYGRPCAAVETFTWSPRCVYVQVDGVAGHNSSDPYVCSDGPTTPPTTEPPTTEPPTSPPTTVPPTEPPTNTPTPTDPPTLPPNTETPDPEPTEPPTTEPPTETPDPSEPPTSTPPTDEPPVTEPPTEQPTIDVPTEEPPVTETPTDEPTTPAPPVASEPPPTSGTTTDVLPNTGAPAWGWLAAGIACILGGLGAMLYGRRQDGAA